MHKEFVPYNLAIQMKELGFDEPCLAWYDGKYIEYINRGYCTNSEEPYNDKRCTAPLYQQAFRWFRDNHNLLHLDMLSMGVIEHKRPYEEVELGCIIRLIEMVKSK